MRAHASPSSELKRDVLLEFGTSSCDPVSQPIQSCTRICATTTVHTYGRARDNRLRRADNYSRAIENLAIKMSDRRHPDRDSLAPFPSTPFVHSRTGYNRVHKYYTATPIAPTFARH